MATDMKLAGELIMRCFQARTAAHVLHLKTKSYAEHKALNEFYDEIVGLADKFAEMVIGETGELITEFPDGYRTPNSSMALVNGLANWIAENREKVCDWSQGQNQIDEIMALCNTTAYKLKFLK